MLLTYRGLTPATVVLLAKELSLPESSSNERLTESKAGWSGDELVETLFKDIWVQSFFCCANDWSSSSGSTKMLGKCLLNCARRRSKLYQRDSLTSTCHSWYTSLCAKAPDQQEWWCTWHLHWLNYEIVMGARISKIVGATPLIRATQYIL